METKQAKQGDAQDRTDVQKTISSTAFFEHSQGNCFFHGRAYAGPGADAAPQVTWQSKVLPREDHGSTVNWLTATEYNDQNDVIDAKCVQLAQMIQMSNKTVIYSGAGISVPALIGQAAKGSSGKGSKSSDAQPTHTHFALGTLGRHGLLHGWVQQNHDGLPQKAGFPQENINEIHGSWFDPSNPVVKYSGTLKDDAYPKMIHDADTADLVIVVGTSLGGLNADQVANKTAKRSLRNKPWKADGTGGALGTVIINLQQTEQDGKATLRMFGTTDTVLPRVLEKLGLAQVSDCKCGKRFCREENGYMYSENKSKLTHQWQLKLLAQDGTMQATEQAQFLPTDRKALVPYDKDGKRTSDDSKMMVLDLSNGAAVKITEGHNIQGAGQPAYLHIGADKPYKKASGQVVKNGPGHGKVSSFSTSQSAFKLDIEGATMTLGAWWLEAAKRGAPETLPVVNLKPSFTTVEAKPSKPVAPATTATAAAPDPVPSPNVGGGVATAGGSVTVGAGAATPPVTVGAGATTPPPASVDQRSPEPSPTTIEVGNVATLAAEAAKGSEEQWKWTIFVEGDEVAETTFHLHPTFNPTQVVVAADSNGKCSLSRTGWGTFDIRCAIKLRDGTVVEKVHSLTFKEERTSKVYQL